MGTYLEYSNRKVTEGSKVQEFENFEVLKCSEKNNYKGIKVQRQATLGFLCNLTLKFITSFKYQPILIHMENSVLDFVVSDTTV